MAGTWLARMLVLAALGSMATPALAQTLARACNTINANNNYAQNHYENMRLDQAIDWLEACRAGDRWRGLHKDQKTAVLRLLALSHQAKNERDPAREAVRVLVRTDRRYSTNVNDPIFFRNWVKEFKPKWYQKRWVQLGGAVLVGGVSAFLLTRKPTLPIPPLGTPPGWPPPPGN